MRSAVDQHLGEHVGLWWFLFRIFHHSFFGLLVIEPCNFCVWLASWKATQCLVFRIHYSGWISIFKPSRRTVSSNPLQQVPGCQKKDMGSCGNACCATWLWNWKCLLGSISWQEYQSSLWQVAREMQDDEMETTWHEWKPSSYRSSNTGFNISSLACMRLTKPHSPMKCLEAERCLGSSFTHEKDSAKVHCQ